MFVKPVALAVDGFDVFELESGVEGFFVGGWDFDAVDFYAFVRVPMAAKGGGAFTEPDVVFLGAGAHEEARGVGGLIGEPQIQLAADFGQPDDDLAGGFDGGRRGAVEVPAGDEVREGISLGVGRVAGA